tara:strand:- start:576 stop:863 length:288 start_codon:yes stop_codon:yes gene_type:complete
LIKRHLINAINVEHATNTTKSNIAVVSVTGITFEKESNQVTKDRERIPNGLLMEYPLSGIALKNFSKTTKVEIPISSINSSQTMPYNIVELYRMN